MIHIALIDDQALVRQGIASLLSLSPNFDLVWQAGSGEQALQLHRSQDVDVMLVDVRMPHMDGIEFLREIRINDTNTKVIMLTTFDEPELFLEAMKEGANGFLLKDIDSEKLSNAIELVYQGQTLAEPVLLGQLSQSQLATFADPNIEPLNERELSILKLIAAGYSNKEIAEAVFLAPGTVKNHVSAILAKLQTRDRTRAVLKAMSAGLLNES
ncbi:two component transcriptional regulator, LuxR family [Pseudoalteromonas luteoviolacea B = ATCC 29581]|nr:two component transcriptional regulator, LuxR family [Pseudoalteromonas luteoviolacea B = ATCC 29581]